MITEEEYEDLISIQMRYEDRSCSCHINPPCEKCINGLSDEDLEKIKEYEEHNAS